MTFLPLLRLNNLKTESSAGVGERDGGRSNGQVVGAGLESVLIGNEGQGKLLAFGRDPIDGSFLSVASVVAVILAVSILRVSGELLLGVGFFTGSVVRLSIAALMTNE